ncbi:LPS export ABC transporter permease LptF [Alcanivorax sp. JB21]|uniref:LPS export ABC transporter permease LptF n=1 Tax=Alcanivorax limicola TaxID=2874102 RepID=UPI001CBCBB1F|nr:LPS export ABC transporter permease LptF [Alcanivorax limicola]MBZ2189469.1 LPS export ABC transporter permease LptF [Alcanivorax limicola]
MILYRYVNKQLFMTTVVVTFVLVMVLVSGRFIRYLASAAVGDIDATVLFSVMAFRLPEFLQMILPLSLFIGVLLVLGRMYTDNEVVVLRACGVSQQRLIRAMAAPVAVTTMVIGFFALYVTPLADEEVSRIFEEQQGRSVLELLTPGRFHVRGSGNTYRATYAEGFDRDKGSLKRVFISDFRTYSGESQSEMLTVWAETGTLIEHEGMTYLELLNGHQYSGQPGDGDFRKVLFERALVRVGEERSVPRPPEVRALSTLTLMDNLDDPEADAELQWRIALVLLVPVMTIAAIPLARVNPRQGRFGKLIPAVLLYLFYVGLIMVMRGWIEDTPPAERPFWYHTAWVHLLAIILVASLYLWPVFRARTKGVAQA